MFLCYSVKIARFGAYIPQGTMELTKKYGTCPVCVEWRDSASIQNGWIALSSLDGITVSECLTVGFVVREDKESLVVCSSISNDGVSSPLVNGGMVILKKQITRVSRLTDNQPI